MSNDVIYIFSLLLFIIPGSSNVYSMADHSPYSDAETHFVALEFPVSGLSQLNQSDFELINRNGIRLLYLTGSASLDQLTRLQDLPFRYFFSTNQKYLIALNNLSADSLYLQNLVSDYNLLEEALPDKIAGFAIAVHPLIWDSKTRELLSDFMARLKTTQQTALPLFITIPFRAANIPFPGNLDFINFEVPPFDSYVFLPNQLFSLKLSDNDFENFENLKQVMEQSLQTEKSVIVLNGPWLLERMKVSDEMKVILKNYQENGLLTIPLPAQPQEAAGFNPAVFLLLILIVTYILHYKFQPMYSHSLHRFFFNHHFFTEDVIENRMYLSTPGLILLIQHVVLSGLIFYVTARSLFSADGLDALSHHFHFTIPAFMPDQFFFFFFAGMIFSALSKAVSILWLHFLNRGLPHISQTLTLYAWPLQVNVIIVTLAIIGLNTGINHIVMIILFSLFLFIWFMSFNLAAIDSAKAVPSKYVIYILATAGLHTIIICGIVAAVFLTPEIFKPLQLAFKLP